MTVDARRGIAIVGLGGLGCPAALALVQAGAPRITLIDDDTVDEGNLHRQILYGDRDIGQPKLEAALRSLKQMGATPEQVQVVHRRCLPDNALDLLAGAEVILEGADNYATKFLVCDAAHLLGKPVIHGAALGWQATVLCCAPHGAPCYRCLFEDLPDASAAERNCHSQGVMGPLTGFAGALMADLALRILGGQPNYGALHSYDGKADRLRSIAIARRASCPLCGDHPRIADLNEARYLGESCAA